MDEEARAALDGHTPPAVNLPAPVGRPNGYSPKMALNICDMVAKRHSIEEIGDMEGFPGRSTMFRWLAENEEFAKEYALALQWRTESRIDQMLEIALDSSEDFAIAPIAPAGEGMPAVSGLVEVKDSVKRSSLGVETLKYIIEREEAKKYRVETVLPAAAGAANGDNAKEINPRAPTMIEADPLKGALDACARAAKAPLPNT